MNFAKHVHARIAKCLSLVLLIALPGAMVTLSAVVAPIIVAPSANAAIFGNSFLATVAGNAGGGSQNGNNTCPANMVAVGVGITPNGSSPGFGIYCRSIGTDGQLVAQDQSSAANTSAVGGGNNKVFCPAGKVVTGISFIIWSNVGIRCATPPGVTDNAAVAWFTSTTSAGSTTNCSSGIVAGFYTRTGAWTDAIGAYCLPFAINSISYNVNGGSGSAPATQNQSSPGQTLTVNSSYSGTRTGFHFDGWNSQTDGLGTDYATGSSKLPAAADTLYAKWLSTITYDSNTATSGTTPSATTAKSSAASTTLASNSGASALAKTNFTFSGWNTKADGSGTSYAAGLTTYASGGDTTLYAQWNSTITYSGNGSTGGSVPAATTAKGLAANTTLATNSGSLSKTNLTFNGWNTQQDGKGTHYAAGLTTYASTGSVTLYAEWTATVTFNINTATSGTASSASITDVAGASVTLSTIGTMVKSGYGLIGWNTLTGGTGTSYPVGSTYTASANVTLYATWAPLCSPATTYGGGNQVMSFPAGATCAYVIPTGVTSINTLVVGGGGGGGINVGNGGGGGGLSTATNVAVTPGQVLGISVGAGGAAASTGGNSSLVVGATTYSGTGGSGGGTFGSGATSCSTPTTTAGGTGSTANGAKGGYGVNSSSGGTMCNGGAGTANSTTGTQVIYGAGGGGGGYNSISSPVGGLGGNGVANSGAGNGGNYLSSTGTAGGAGTLGTGGGGGGGSAGNAAGGTGGSGNVIIAFGFISTVTFDVNGASGAPDITSAVQGSVGAAITTAAKNTLSRNGFTFAGWNTASDGTGSTYAESSPFTPQGNTTLYAKWTYTLTYDGTTKTSGDVPPQQVISGAAAPVTLAQNPGNLAQTNYTFVGWNSNSTGSGTLYAPMAPPSLPTPYLQYNATSWNSATNTLNDLSGNNRNATTIRGTPTVATVAATAGTSKTIQVLSGGTADGITFPNAALANYSLCYVARYSGAAKTRIFDAAPNWLSGFYAGSPGVAYHEGWITSQTNTSDTNFHVMCDAGNYFVFDGVNRYTTASTTTGLPAGLTVTNMGREYSDWQIADVIIYNSTLSADQMLQVQMFLREKYGISAATPAIPTYVNSGSAIKPVFTSSTGNATVYAQWNSLITYDANGATSGTVPYSTNFVNQIAGSLAANTGTLAKTNLTFNGWNTKADGTGTHYAAGLSTFVSSGSQKLYAEWTATISFSGNGSSGGTAPASMSAAQNAVITLPTPANTLVKVAGTTTYYFGGWGTAANGTGTTYAAGASYTAAASVPLYALWLSPCTTTQNVYDVYYSQTITSGTGLCYWQVPTGVTSIDALVVGGGGAASYGNNSGSGGAGGVLTATALSVTAGQTFVIKVGAGGVGPGAVTGTGANGSDTIFGSVIAKGGGAGNGGSLGGAGLSGGSGGGGSGTTGAASTCSSTGAGASTQASFSGWVAYGAAGGAGCTSGAVRGGGGGGATAAGTAAGVGGAGITSSLNGTSQVYATGGSWLLDNTLANSGNGAGCFNGQSGSAGIVIIRYAQGAFYRVDYSANATLTSGATPAGQNWLTSAAAITLPTIGTMQRTGFNFLGWADTSTATSANVSSPYSPTASKTLYAVWQGISYTLTYDAQGGSSTPSSQTWNYGANALPLAASSTAGTKTGYLFSGWSLTKGGTLLTGSTYTPTANTVLYAVWAGQPQTVTFNKNEVTSSTTTATQTITVGTATGLTAFSAISGFTRTGYTFAGWATAADGSGTGYADGQQVTIVSALGLYAKWSVNAPGVPTVSVAAGNTEVTVTPTAAATSSTVGAPASFTVTACTNAGALLSPSKTCSIILPATSCVITGLTNGTTYQFAATATNATSTSTSSAKVNATPAAVVIAYDSTSNGGTSGTITTTNTTYNKPTALILPTASKSGYDFSGWYTSQAAGGTLIGGAGATYIPTGAITLYARFTGSVYTITYNGNGNTGGTVPSQGSYANGSTDYNNTQQYNYTGAGQTFVVPSGITGTQQILVEVWGAGGGGTVSYYAPDFGGGAGGYSKATLATPTVGEILTIRVGQGGTVRTGTSSYGGGGAGGVNGQDGSSGGGYSGIFTGNTPLAISGGGGGASPGHSSGGIAGGGGGANQSGGASTDSTMAGRAGTLTAGGAKAATCAGDGSAFTGGAGCSGGAEAGGGGGGGYYGGGGGNSNGQANGGGGGGSGYLDATRGSLITATAGENGAASSTFAFSNTTSPSYVNNAGRGGKSNTNTTSDSGGGNGLIVIKWKTGAGAHVVGAGPTKIGYTFAGWNTAVNGGGTSYSPTTSITPSANISLFAQWTPATRTVTYALASGSSTADTTTLTGKVVGNTVVLPAASTMSRTGYTFTGWNDGTTTYAGGATWTVPASDSNFTITAQWTLITLSYRYDVNGATGSAPASGTKSYNESLTLAGSTGLTKTGYNFGGWNDGTTTRNASDTLTVTSNIVFVAQWSPQSYAITYDGNTATSGSVVSGSFTSGGIPYSIAANGFTKTGYNFTGWKTEASGGNAYAVGAGISPTAATILYAQWSPATYTVTYNANGGAGSVPSVGSFVTASPFTVATNSVQLTKTGYTFGGWCTTASGTGGTEYAEGATNFTTTANTVLYAKWSATAYSVTYDANGGTGTAPTSGNKILGATFTVETSTALTPPAANGAVTYSFAYWNDGSTNYRAGETFRMPAANVVLTAQWIAIYNVTYNGNGGSTSIAPEQKSDASPITIGVAATRSGYTFIKWQDQSNALWDPAATTTVTSGRYIFSATWQATTQTLSFSTEASGGSSAATNVTGTIGEIVSLPATASTKAGYSFGGWSTGGVTYPAGGSFTVGATNAAFTAVWVANANVIVYNANGATGGTVPDNGSYVTGGSTYTVASNRSGADALTKTGFTFAGWYSNAAGTDGTAYSEGATGFTTSTNVTLYAKWNAASYGVTYSTNGGSTAPSSETRMYGSTFSLPATPTKTGFTFTGWSFNSNNYAAGSTFTMGSSAITFTAQWAGIYYAVTYALNGGSGSIPTQADVAAGGSFTTAAAPSKDGFIFAGWSNGAASTSAATSYTNLTGNITLTAQWTVAVPGTPGTPTVVPGNGSATISIVAPSSGGTPTSYTVTVSPALAAPASSSCTVTSPSTSCVITGLTNGSGYTFTSTATNTAGTSSVSPASATAYPATAPTPPTGLTAVAANGKATVSLTGVSTANNGGSAITSYTVTASPAPAAPATGTCQILASANPLSCELTGLTNGTSYSFTATATNASLTSSNSIASNTVAPVAPAGAPTSVSATSTSPGNASISWTAPASDGGGTITSYTVSASPTLPAGAVCTVTGTSASCTGLTNGTAYTFSVAANNAGGASTAGTAASAVTPASAPGVPTGLTATPANGQITLNWTAPSANGSAITGYTITASPPLPNGASCAITGTQAVCTGLTNGNDYSFEVSATNTVGTSGSTSAVTSSPASSPDAPTAITAVAIAGTVAGANNGRVAVTFAPPLNDGGPNIDVFTVNAYLANGSIAASCTVATDPNATNYASTYSCTVAALTNGTAYTFKVFAHNSIGNGSLSDSSSAVTPSTIPSSPTTVSATAADKNASVTFTPADNGGSAVDYYVVTASPGGATARGTTSPITVAGLTNGAPYTFTIVAHNANGNSVSSAPSNAATPVPLAPPTINNALPGNVITGVVEVGYTLTSLGFFGGSPTPVNTYQWLSCSSTVDPATDNTVCTTITRATSKTYQPTVADLGKYLRVVVSASNSQGRGEPDISDPTIAVVVTALATRAPTIPSPIQAGVAIADIVVAADPGSGTGAGTITYRIMGSLPAALTFDPITATIKGSVINPGTYSFAVLATDANGGTTSTPITLVVTAPVGPIVPPLPAGPVAPARPVCDVTCQNAAAAAAKLAADNAAAAAKAAADKAAADAAAKAAADKAAADAAAKIKADAAATTASTKAAADAAAAAAAAKAAVDKAAAAAQAKAIADAAAQAAAAQAKAAADAKAAAAKLAADAAAALKNSTTTAAAKAAATTAANNAAAAAAAAVKAAATAAANAKTSAATAATQAKQVEIAINSLTSKTATSQTAAAANAVAAAAKAAANEAANAAAAQAANAQKAATAAQKAAADTAAAIAATQKAATAAAATAKAAADNAAKAAAEQIAATTAAQVKNDALVTVLTQKATLAEQAAKASDESARAEINKQIDALAAKTEQAQAAVVEANAKVEAATSAQASTATVAQTATAAATTQAAQAAATKTESVTKSQAAAAAAAAAAIATKAAAAAKAAADKVPSKAAITTPAKTTAKNSATATVTGLKPGQSVKVTIDSKKP